MTEFCHSTPRELRSLYRRQLRFPIVAEKDKEKKQEGDKKSKPQLKLVVLSPKQHGRPNWRFGIMVHDVVHVLPKRLASKEEGLQVAEARFGVKAKTFQQKKKS